jgi:hypothetical protein
MAFCLMQARRKGNAHGKATKESFEAREAHHCKAPWNSFC